MADVVTQRFVSGFRLIDGTELNDAFDQVNNALDGTTALTALDVTGSVTALTATATTAGGAGPVLAMGTANVGVYFGSGAPTVSAPKGSLYLCTDGSSTSTRLYVNTNGTTGWTNVTTAT